MASEAHSCGLQACTFALPFAAAKLRFAGSSMHACRSCNRAILAAISSIRIASTSAAKFSEDSGASSSHLCLRVPNILESWFGLKSTFLLPLSAPLSTHHLPNFPKTIRWFQKMVVSILAMISLINVYLAMAAKVICYDLAGSPNPSHVPCNPNAKGASSCCAPTSPCLTNNACYYPDINGVSRGVSP